MSAKLYNTTMFAMLLNYPARYVYNQCHVVLLKCHVILLKYIERQFIFVLINRCFPDANWNDIII